MTKAMDMSEFCETDLSELDRLLNDPDVPMHASRVWELLEKMSAQVNRPASD